MNIVQLFYFFIGCRCCLWRNWPNRSSTVRQMVWIAVLRSPTIGSMHMARRYPTSQSRKVLRLHEVRHRTQRAGSRRPDIASDRHEVQARSKSSRRRRFEQSGIFKASIRKHATREEEATRGVERHLRTSMVFQQTRRYLGV